MTPEEYQQALSEGFEESTRWITALPVLIAAALALAFVLWMVYVREEPFLDLVIRPLAVTALVLGALVKWVILGVLGLIELVYTLPTALAAIPAVFVNPLQSILSAAPEWGRLSLVRASLRLPVVHAPAAVMLAHGSIALALILFLFDIRPRKERRMSPRQWMLSPTRARHLLLSFAGPSPGRRVLPPVAGSIPSSKGSRRSPPILFYSSSQTLR